MRRSLIAIFKPTELEFVSQHQYHKGNTYYKGCKQEVGSLKKWLAKIEKKKEFPDFLYVGSCCSL